MSVDKRPTSLARTLLNALILVRILTILPLSIIIEYHNVLETCSLIIVHPWHDSHSTYIKCLWGIVGGKGRGSNLQERVLHTYTHNICLFRGEIGWMKNFGEKMGRKTFLSVFGWWE